MRLLNGRSAKAAAPAPLIAEAFTADRWRPDARRTDGVEIRVSASDGEELVDSAMEVGASVLEFASSRLGVPSPPVRALRSAELADGDRRGDH